MVSGSSAAPRRQLAGDQYGQPERMMSCVRSLVWVIQQVPLRMRNITPMTGTGLK
jgi:hypothetical protein